MLRRCRPAFLRTLWGMRAAKRHATESLWVDFFGTGVGLNPFKETMRACTPFLTRIALVAAAGVALVGCGALFPALKTPVRPAPEAYEPNPAPPSDLLYVTFQGATIPLKTRDGRKWDEVGGEEPDTFAKLIVDGREIITTPVQANTRAPTWPNQKRANYRIERGKSVVVQVWDANPITNHPICSEKIFNIQEEAGTAPIEIDCDSGAHVVLDVRPAQPVIGLGFDYELIGNGIARVTRVVRESPAGRAGIEVGAKFTSVQGKQIKTLDPLQVQSIVNSNSRTGLDLTLLSPDGKPKQVNVREAAMYVLADDEARILP